MSEQFSQHPGRSIRHRRRLAVAIAAGALVVVAVPFAAWEAWWPTNVDARALDAFGLPTAGAARTGRDWVTSGNAACLDSCTELTRTFTVPSTLTLGQVLGAAERAAHRAGYATPFGITCMVTTPVRSEFMCAVVGQTSTLGVQVSVYGVDPAVVKPGSMGGDGLSLTPDERPVTEVRVGISER